VPLSIPYIVTIVFIQNIDHSKPLNGPEKRADKDFFEPLLNVTFVVGLVLAFAFAMHLVIHAADDFFSSERSKLLTSTSNMLGEWRSKQVRFLWCLQQRG